MKPAFLTLYFLLIGSQPVIVWLLCLAKERPQSERTHGLSPSGKAILPVCLENMSDSTEDCPCGSNPISLALLPYVALGICICHAKRHPRITQMEQSNWLCFTGMKEFIAEFMVSEPGHISFRRTELF